MQKWLQVLIFIRIPRTFLFISSWEGPISSRYVGTIYNPTMRLQILHLLTHDLDA